MKLLCMLPVGTPDKLEREFNNMRSQLEPCLVNFRLSGMGDCPAEEKQEQSLKVYSSKFSAFCSGKPMVAYLYELLVREQDLLSSFATEMPSGTSHTSESKRSISSLCPSGDVKKNKQKKSISKEAAKEDTALNSLANALRAPVQVETVQESKALQQIKYKKARYDAMKARVDLRSALENELEKTFACIDALKSKNEEVPQYYISKRQRLFMELSELDAEKSLTHQEATASTDQGSSSSAVPHSVAIESDDCDM